MPLLLMLMAGKRHSLTIKSVTAGNSASSSSTSSSSSLLAGSATPISIHNQKSSGTKSSHMNDSIKLEHSPMMQNPLLPKMSTSFSGSSSGETVIEAQFGCEGKLTNGLDRRDHVKRADEQKKQTLKSQLTSDKCQHEKQKGLRSNASHKSQDHNQKHREHLAKKNHVATMTTSSELINKCDVAVQVGSEIHSKVNLESKHKSSNGNKSFSSSLFKSMNRLNPFGHNSSPAQMDEAAQCGWYETFAQRYLRRKSMQPSKTSEHSADETNCSNNLLSAMKALASQSAPTTPVKWQMQGDAATPTQKPNLAIVISCSSEHKSSSLATAIQHSASRPSVRFADDGGDKPADSGNYADEHDDCLEDNDCLEEDGLEEEICEEEEDFGARKASEIVEKLFQFPSAAQLAISSHVDSKSPSSNLVTTFGKQNGECPMDSGHFRHYGYRLIDYICNYLDTIKERRVTPLNIEPGYLKSLIEAAAPEQGEPFPKIMQDFEKHIMCGITHWQHPHFHAYFPAGNAYPSILADMLSDALGCVGFSWAASPAYTELEIIMLDWMGKMIGLPDEFLCLSGSQESRGGGVIQGSASECVLVNLLAARHWAIERLRSKYPREPDGMLLSKLIGYCSKEAHSCVEKAAMIGFIRMRALDTDEKQSLRGETLARAIEADLEQGLEPFLVCATLGTTSCVSFDNLLELGSVCEKHDIWLHVDAAYAGSALICPEFKYLMRGIEKASSFNMNPNKWMLINFDCSLMWVKDRFKLTRAFVVDPLYLQHSYSDQAIDYRHWGIPLSRRFRALKLWFTIRNYGINGLQAYVRNHVKLAKLFETLIRSDARFSVTNQVVLGLVCFRLVGSNALNQRLLSIINASGKLHMVPASVNGRYVIRFCICEQNAREEDVRYAYENIANFATELIASVRAGKERFRAISAQNTVEMLASALPIGLQSPEEASRQDDTIPNTSDVSPPSSKAASRLSQRSISMDSSRLATPSSASSLLVESPAEQLANSESLVKRAQSALPNIEQMSRSPVGPETRLGVSARAIYNGSKSPLTKQKSMLANDSDQQQHSQLQFHAAQLNKTPTIDQQQQDSEQFKTAQRRARVTSGRYKRKFFVRVVSDPRVYRASISGDINAHSSSSSLANNASIVSNSSQITISDGTSQPQTPTANTHTATSIFDHDQLLMQEEKSSN